MEKLLIIYALFFTNQLAMAGMEGLGQNQFIPVSDDNSNGQIIAFPGAEGFGKYTTGGRDGKVLIVSNLNDDGPGSLRQAVRVKEPRTIVFAVSGTIALESPLDINTGNLTIAGQTAPGDGICLKNYPLKVKGDNIIIRYMRVRLGDEKKTQDDAISVIRQKNIILDHCSFSWGTDEVASCYDNENFTMQWCIISESLNASVHEKGDHGYGGIWGGKKATFHHNLLAHHSSRNPRFCGSRYHKRPAEEIVDFRNNVIYNWKLNASYAGEEGNHNLVNNYYKPGPATPSSKSARILDPFKPYGNFFLSGNILEGHHDITRNNSLGVVGGYPKNDLLKSEVTHEPIKGQAAQAAFDLVLSQVGANIVRDKVDDRVVNDTRIGRASFGPDQRGIINSQKEVGGWPELKAMSAPQDKDKDGMPDLWELENGLDPENPSDHSGRHLHQDYSNLEFYLNQIIVLAHE